MLFSIDSSILKNAISKLGKVKSAKDIKVSNFCTIEALEGGKCKLTKLNELLRVDVLLDADVETTGVIAIPFNTLKMATKLPLGKISTTNNKFFTQTGKSVDFEHLVDQEMICKESSFKDIKCKYHMTVEELKELLSCRHSASKDETRPILKGLYFDDDRVCALDGYRLSYRIANKKHGFNFVVDITGIEFLCSILDKYKGENVEIHEKKYNVDFIIDDITVSCRKLEGEFIKYKMLIPQEYKFDVVVRTDDLLEALNFVSQNDKIVRINFKEDNIDIYTLSENAKLNDIVKYKDKYNVPYDFLVAINSKYIVEALKSIGDKTVSLKFVSNINPIVIKHSKGLELVLPIRMAK